MIGCIIMVHELGAVWRANNIDESIQRFKHQPLPQGFKLLYAIVCLDGTEKAYIGKAGHTEKGAVYRIEHKGGHVLGPNTGRSAIHDAIVSLGWSNFVWFILAGPIPTSEINDAETEAIRRFNTLTKSQGGNGYNIMKGGDGGEKTECMIANQKATMATEKSIKKRSAISKAMWTPEYRESVHMRHLGSAESIAKRTASLGAAKGRPEVIENHKRGGKLMWSGEKGEKRRSVIEERKNMRLEELRSKAVPLPSKTEDRVDKMVYIVQVAKRAQIPGSLVQWRVVKTRSGMGTTGFLKKL